MELYLNTKLTLEKLIYVFWLSHSQYVIFELSRKKFELGRFELSRFELSRFELGRFELGGFELSRFELSGVRPFLAHFGDIFEFSEMLPGPIRTGPVRIFSKVGPVGPGRTCGPVRRQH